MNIIMDKRTQKNSEYIKWIESSPKLKLILVSNVYTCTFSGIYILVDRDSGSIEYVGQSRNIAARFFAHEYYIPEKHNIFIEKSTTWNSVDRYKRENELIILLNPTLNKIPHGLIACGVCGYKFRSCKGNKRYCSGACKQKAYRIRNTIIEKLNVTKKEADDFIFFGRNLAYKIPEVNQ